MTMPDDQRDVFYITGSTTVIVLYEPQPDITAYELARIIPLLNRTIIFEFDLPKDQAVLRHLKIVRRNHSEPVQKEPAGE
jgi:hypothetical protein